MALRDQLRVMVVDDMSTSRGLITQALDALGITQVEATASAREALQSMAKRPVHLVISDYNMPEVDGLQFLHHLRSSPATQKTGFILITGRAEQSIIDHGRKLGMNNFLKKPFETQQIRACIEAVVGRL